MAPRRRFDGYTTRALSVGAIQPAKCRDRAYKLSDGGGLFWFRVSGCITRKFIDDFPINQIEHDIRAVAADPDYRNSAWLSFILPFDAADQRAHRLSL